DVVVIDLTEIDPFLAEIGRVDVESRRFEHQFDRLRRGAIVFDQQYAHVCCLPVSAVGTLGLGIINELFRMVANLRSEVTALLDDPSIATRRVGCAGRRGRLSRDAAVARLLGYLVRRPMLQRYAGRQPAALASSSVQNQRLPGAFMLTLA